MIANKCGRIRPYATGIAILVALMMNTAMLQADQPGQVCLGTAGMPWAEDMRLEQQVIEVERATRAAYAELPFAELRVVAAQRVLGSEPEVLFHFVRDETRWLPYAGVLRGADGVMLDRMGSSLDRALLLATLLEEAGHEARLASAALDAAGLEALHAAWAQLPVATRPEAEFDDVEERAAIIAVAQRHGLDPTELDDLYREQQTASDQTRERLLAQVQRQHAALQAVLGESELNETELNETEPNETELGASLPGDSVTNHWWVEWRSSGGWRALDPALPEHEPGDRLAAVGDDVEHYYPEALPEEVYHRLNIQVVAEQFDNGRLQEHIALEHQVATADLLGRQLQLELYPLGLPSLQSLLEEGDALATLPARLLEQQQWMPYLRIGDSLVRQQIIHADGSVEDPGAQSAAGRAVGEAAALLGGISVGGGLAQQQAPSPELTAVFLRFSVEAPGRDTDLFERPMMDLLGPAQRAAGDRSFAIDTALREQRAAALLGTLELLGQTTWLPPSQQTAWHYEALLDNRQASLGVAYAASYGDFSFMSDSLEARSLRREELDQLAGLRLAFSPYLERVALTRLNLLGYVSLVDYRAGVLERREGFDILDNRVDVPSGASPSAASLASIRLAQGILDTLLEAELLSTEVAPLSNTATAYDQALAQQSAWQMVDGAAALDTLDWQPPPDLLAHFDHTLAEGKILVMPVALIGEAVPTWWQLDPATGDVLGYGPDRRGQAVEALLTLISAGDNAMGAVEMVLSIWNCLLTSEDPHCCARTAAANEAISKMAGKGLAAAAHAQRVNLIIGRSIVHGSTFRSLNAVAVSKVAGKAGEVIAGAATSAVGCS